MKQKLIRIPWKKVIEEFPDNTSSDMIEGFVNEELDYSNQNYSIEENGTGLYDEEG